MSIFNMLLAGGSFVAPTPNFYSANRRRTLMLLGDSITWGWGVFQYQTYAKAMQEKIDTVLAGGTNTDEWVSRNVHADDLIENRDGVTLKLQSPVGILYQNSGPFGSTYSREIVDAVFTGSISGTTLTVSSVSSGTIRVGQTIRNTTGSGITSETYIVSLGSGTGGVGTYNVNNSQSVGSTSISAYFNPAILLNGLNSEVQVTPSSLQNPVRYLTIMVKVTGSGSATVTSPGLTPLTGTVATVGGSNIGVNNIYRFIYDTGSSSTSFTIRRTDTAGGAVCRLLSINPTNFYPPPPSAPPDPTTFATNGYINVQINARGSYTFDDYSNDMADIHESVIFPLSDPLTPTVAPVYVIALGTVSMYFNTVSASPPGDRRISPSAYLTELNALIDAIQTVSPTSPIVLTYPPTPNSASWYILPGFTRSDYDDVIQFVSNSRRLPTVDLRTTLTNADYSDGLHPTVAGQTKLGTAYINGLGL